MLPSPRLKPGDPTNYAYTQLTQTLW
ncbi:hypothetical protein RSAG8_01664, partial [Rhizoctonia solani AG-8 WAC10335]